MPARLAFPFIYRSISAALDEEQRLELDELLGDPKAAERRVEQRQAAVAMAGFEVG